MIFYDVEVFKNNWLIVIYDMIKQDRIIIWDDPEMLKAVYENNIKNIWIGYNSRHYDQYILKSILLGMNPKTVNDKIINDKLAGWQISNAFRQLPLFNFDIMTTMHGLKQLEGFLGHNIKETTVPFDIDRSLTDHEKNEVTKYCIHDVEETINVFLHREEEFTSQMSLLKEFKLPLSYVSKTKPQLSAIILGAIKYDRGSDEFDFEIQDTIQLSKYKNVASWYKNKCNHDYNKTLNIDVAGVNHQFAWGGLHGAINNYIDNGVFVMSDIASMYPALMIEYNFGSRNIKDPNKYKSIRDQRLILKKNKDAKQLPYKIVLNSTYGAMKDKHNNLYDPRQCNNVCINGQLMLLDLIEKLEYANIGKLIQSNTDGILFKLYSKEYYDQYLDICAKWSQRVRLDLEHDFYSKVIQKDVNNYIIVTESGKVKSKGAYVKQLTPIDYDLPIVNDAVINYFINDTPAEVTINNCNELKKFQKIVKISSKYKGLHHNGVDLEEKTVRVFASRSRRDGQLFKLKDRENTFGKREIRREKIANTPEKCFIINEDINGRNVISKINKRWYIEIANKRIKDFIGIK